MSAVLEQLAPETPDAPVAPLPGRRSMRVLHVDGDVVHAGVGLDLHRSDDGGETFERVARHEVGPLDRTLARTPIASRLLRAGFHGLVPLANGDLVAIVRGAVLLRRAGETRFEVAHRVTRGTRPLNVCLAPSGRLYFGEYFANQERGEVHVYGSDDGRSWDVVHSFAAGSIRHVHGIWPDPHRGGVWVLTGDDDHESGIYFSGDDFASLDPVATGSQRARAVTVLPTAEGLVVPTDTPREPNVIQFMDTDTGALEPVAAVPGSVFSGAFTGRLLAVSTTVEKSSVNLDSRAALLVSEDGRRWTTVARRERDLPLLRDRRGYLQLPTLQLPAGRGGGRLFATGQALAGHHGRLMAWDEDALLAAHRSAQTTGPDKGQITGPGDAGQEMTT